MADKLDQDRDLREPIINTVRNRSGLYRFILLGIFLIFGVATLGISGTEKLGEPVVLAILGVFASVGIFFLFALVLGMVRLDAGKYVEEFTQTLIRAMDSGVVVTDAGNRVIYASHSYAELIGAAQSNDVTNIETAFSRKAEAAEIIYKISKQARSGKTVVEEIRLDSGFVPEHNTARWYRLRATPVSIDDDKKPCTVWQIVDVTKDRIEQENAFQALQEAIHYLDHAPAGFMASEENGSLAYINATLADWLGLDLVEFEPGHMNVQQIIADDSLALFNTLQTTSTASSTTILDMDMIRTDGKLLPVRIYCRMPYALDSAPGSLRLLVLNRSGELGASDALRDAEIRFTRFFNNTPIAIASLAEDGTIMRTNAPFLRMFTPLIQDTGHKALKHYAEMVGQQDRDELAKPFEQALSAESSIKPIDFSINGDDKRHIRFFFNPVTSGEGEEEAGGDNAQERVIVYVMEITEQRALEDQFAKGQKMQAVGQLAGGIAHDFNNVLTAIIGFSDLLLGNHKPSDPSFQDIMNIKQNANRAASLVRQLLAFSRRQTLRPRVLHLSDALSDLRMLLDRLAGDSINLELKHGRDLWPVKVDISQFEQVIVNLVVNARDAMENEGTLSIHTLNITSEECTERYSFTELLPGDYVQIEVKDTGSGMSAEIMDKIFDPFFSTKEVGKGTGLGLSTVYGIVKQTGGFIYPESEEGTGTVFRLFLPRHVPSEKAEEETGTENVGPKDDTRKDLTGTATILLVEDEDAVRAFGSRALTSRGYKVHEAESGIEALAIMEEHGDEINLVVSDVVMPEMDGPTLLGELRKTYPDLRFVFVSGYAEEAFAKNLPKDEHGNFGFLPKPFSLKQLATTVKEMLEE